MRIIMSLRARVCQIGLLTVCVILFLVSVDILVNHFVISRGTINDIVEIQSPSVLEAKLDYLKHFGGYKVVLLGDSIIYGAVLREHGDHQWREHNLANVLTRRIRMDFPDRDVLVMNLGMNGAVPGDIEVLAHLLDDGCPDLVVLDISLRSFSEDFSLPAERLSRPWLAELEDQDAVPNRQSHASCLEHGLKKFLMQQWAIYRYRDFLQLRLLGKQPGEALRDLHEHIDQTLRSPNATAENSEDEFILAMKARQRYQSIHLRPDHAQRQALEGLLTHLSQRKQKTVVFYAKENPQTITSLIDQREYAELIDCLEKIIISTAGPETRYLRSLAELGPERFLDHVHVDGRGYEILAKHIWATARDSD
jgi:lysophospholipase L1-like esterase